MKILLTGASGQLGSELLSFLKNSGSVIAPDRQALDLSSPEMIGSYVRQAQPDVIINAAAYTEVDKAEAEETKAVMINGIASGALAKAAAQTGALLIHYSTDYVFDGEKAEFYNEDDKPAPLNVYGRSKLLGEELVRQSGCDYLVFRLSWLYAAKGRNFVNSILAQNKPALKVVNDQFGAPCWVRPAAMATAEIIAKAMRERQGGNWVSGLYHMTAGGKASWHDFAGKIIDKALHCGKITAKPELHSISSRDYISPAQRPRNSCLSSSRLQERFGIRLDDWETIFSDFTASEWQ